MYWALFVATIISIPVALIFVGAAVNKTAAMPRQVVFDVHEAIEFTALALPDEVTAEVSYDDLQRALRLHFEWIQAFHWTPESSDSIPVVFEANDPIEYMTQRCEVIGLDLSQEQLKAISQSHYQYLMAKGALLTQPVEMSEADLNSLDELEA